MNHHDSYLAKETFKDRLWDTLKELKIEISNEKGLGKATLQCDQELKHLTATNGHATNNVLRKHQSHIDGVVIPKTPSSS